MGPYDLPPAAVSKTSWTFEKDSADWRNTMNLDSSKVESGPLQAVSVGNDPAFFGPPIQARANEFSHVRLRMRLTAVDGKTSRDTAQLFWASRRWPESEASSIHFPVFIDGQWHDYELPVSENQRWKGVITRLRLDPANRSGMRVEIQTIALKPAIPVSSQTLVPSTRLTLTGDWQLLVSDVPGSSNATVSVPRPEVRVVNAERHDRMPLFNSNAWGGWTKGIALRGIVAQECTTPGLLEPDSLVLRSGPSQDSVLFEYGRDYAADLAWGAMGTSPRRKNSRRSTRVRILSPWPVADRLSRGHSGWTHHGAPGRTPGIGASASPNRTG
jgi:hypothetical protein